jgi:hypothetical protein
LVTPIALRLTSPARSQLRLEYWPVEKIGKLGGDIDVHRNPRRPKA